MVTLQQLATSCGGSKGRCPCEGKGWDLLVPMGCVLPMARSV